MNYHRKILRNPCETLNAFIVAIAYFTREKYRWKSLFPNESHCCRSSSHSEHTCQRPTDRMVWLHVHWSSSRWNASWSFEQLPFLSLIMKKQFGFRLLSSSLPRPFVITLLKMSTSNLFLHLYHERTQWVLSLFNGQLWLWMGDLAVMILAKESYQYRCHPFTTHHLDRKEDSKSPCCSSCIESLSRLFSLHKKWQQCVINIAAESLRQEIKCQGRTLHHSLFLNT